VDVPDYLASGIVLRYLPVPGFIWAGTALIGLAIAFLNVLVPSLVKRDFPTKVSRVTGSYTATQAAFAAIGAAAVVPVAQTSPAGWRLALGIWVGLALIAMTVLLPWLRELTPEASRISSDPLRNAGIRVDYENH
jgi:CP family cyanate transporter-like MFS transporter